MVSAAPFGASAKHFSRSADTGRSVASTMSFACASASSRVTLPSRRPSVPAEAPLEVASAWKPSAARMRAEPASHGLGITNASGPVCSARKRTALSCWVVAMIVLLPGQRVGRPARVGAGREHAGLGIAVTDDGADAAGADLADGVAERAQLRPDRLGDAGLDVELTGPVRARPERVDERLRRETRRLDGLLRVHAEDEHVEHDLEIGLGLVVAAGAADGRGRHAVLADQVVDQRR